MMWCTGHWVGAEPACPQWCGCSTHRESIYTALCSAHKGLGDGQRPSPSRQAHRPTPVSEGKGSGGRELGGQGARVAGAPHGEMQAGENGGGDTLLTCVPSRRRSRNIPNIGLEVGVEIRDLRQRAGTQLGIAGVTAFSVQYTCRCAMPTLLAALPPQFKQLHARSSCTPATVRYTRVQKGGGAIGCAAGGAAHRGFRTSGGRLGSLGRCPLAELIQDPRSPSLAPISPSSEGLSGAHHADKTNFSGRGSPQDFLAQCRRCQLRTDRSCSDAGEHRSGSPDGSIEAY